MAKTYDQVWYDTPAAEWTEEDVEVVFEHWAKQTLMNARFLELWREGGGVSLGFGRGTTEVVGINWDNTPLELWTLAGMVDLFWEWSGMMSNERAINNYEALSRWCRKRVGFQVEVWDE